MHGVLAEGALSGLEFQFEPEWIDRGPANGQLAFRCAWQNAAGQQTPIGRLSHVVAPCYPRATAHLFGQFAHRVQEVHIGAGQLVDRSRAASAGASRRWYPTRRRTTAQFFCSTYAD